jgi:hypothetical protein
VQVPKVADISLQHINHHSQDKLEVQSRITAQKSLLALQVKRMQAFANSTTVSGMNTAMYVYSSESTFHCVMSIRSRARRPTGIDWFDSWYIMKMVRHPASLMVRAYIPGSYEMAAASSCHLKLQ